MLRKLFHTIIESPKQNIISQIIRRIFHHIRNVDRNTILLLSSNMGSHSELYAIAKAMIDRKLPFKIYWAADSDLTSAILPKQIKKVSIGSYKFFRALAISHILVEDSFAVTSFKLPKKANQVLFQTWENSIYGSLQNSFYNSASHSLPVQKKATHQIDYCIIGSLFETEFFHSVLDTDIPMLAYGHARNDQFFVTDKRKIAQLHQKICSNADISPEHQILCYETSQPTTLSTQELQMLEYALKEKFSGNWSIILKKTEELPVYADAYLLEGSVRSLDYMISQHPCFFLKRDLGSIAPELDFFAETPFPVSSTISEVVEQIYRFDIVVYQKQIFSFFREYGIVEDGHASERLIEKFLEII